MENRFAKYAQAQQATQPEPQAAPVNRFAKYAQQPAQAQAPMQQPVQPVAAEPEGWLDWAGRVGTDVAASTADGLRQGVAAMLGAPVELINAAPMIGNILPGEQGFTPLSDRPAGGMKDFDEILRFGVPRVGALVDDYQPQTFGGRMANRVGEEIGASMVPIAAAGATAARVGTEGARQMGPLARRFVEPMAVDPGRVVGREITAATAAGSGAQLANEAFDPQEHKGNFWTDFLGSVGGLTALGGVKALGNLGNQAIGAVTDNAKRFEDIAGRVVADDLIDNSTTMQRQYADRGIADANDLAGALSRPSAAEELVPGFQANIADRVTDPGLSSFTYNVDGRAPGAMMNRITNNAAAIDNRMTGLAPEGDATLLRQRVAEGANARITGAEEAELLARTQMEDALAQINPSMSPVERGAAIREALQSAKDSVFANIKDLYSSTDPNTPVDLRPLRDRFDATTEALPMNDRDRFLPSEVGTARRLVPESGPVNTGVLDASGNQITRAPDPANGTLGEALSIRSGLSSDIRSPAALDQGRRVTGQYMDDVDTFLRSVLSEEDRLALDAAQASRLDAGRRFEDTGAIPTILNRTGRDQYVAPAEAVAGMATRQETNYSAIMREAGSNEGLRRSVADQIVADAQNSNALRSPDALARFAQERGFALKDFPEVKTALERAGVSKQAFDQAVATTKTTRAQFKEGGSSPAGQFLKYDNTGVGQAMQSAWNSPQPERNIKELLDVAGDTPEVRKAAKAALWDNVTSAGKNSAKTATSADGVQRWSGRKLEEIIKNPKFAKAAEMLWEDNPKHLEDIKEVFGALAKADGSINAKPPGTSGTAASLSGKLDSSLSTTSIASRMRSVNRGQLSPTIAVIDVASTWLRNRSAKVQAKAIEEMTARAINDPDFAATLLRKFNPADEAAMRKQFLSQWGVRMPTIAGAFIDDEGDDVSNWANEADEGPIALDPLEIFQNLGGR